MNYHWNNWFSSLEFTWRAEWRWSMHSPKVKISQGDTSPSQEISVCIRETPSSSGGKTKSYKIQLPTWPTGPWLSGSQGMPPCSLSFLFSPNKHLWPWCSNLPLISISERTKNPHYPEVPAYHLCIILETILISFH
jgi:hypothetical protein